VRSANFAESLAAETLRMFCVRLDRVPRAERQRVTDALEVLAKTVAGSETRS